ncbi:MAG: hypothetical protein VB117_11795, partial [[Clostridium] scindens]|uniref:hypothetical protein n=1 Tax=Clostridium scindens (strain JCM 10418 / VPI 12708) TaxID=29347 RepID=UPI002B2119DB
PISSFPMLITSSISSVSFVPCQLFVRIHNSPGKSCHSLAILPSDTIIASFLVPVTIKIVPVIAFYNTTVKMGINYMK